MVGTQSLQTPKLAWPGGAILGEGPVWIEHESALYWVDIKGCMIHRLSWPSGDKKSWRTHSQIGALHPLKQGNFIGAFKDGLYIVTLDIEAENADVQLITDPEAHLPDNRFNDAKVGPDGAFWAGTMDDLEATPTGSLYRLSPQGKCMAVDKGYIVTNGPAFSRDEKTLYHTDTFAGIIYAFDLSQKGSLSNKREFITIPKENGFPDGMCVDDEDCLWVGLWGGHGLTRFSPKGKTLSRIELPVANVTSCVFGGADMKTLFITTASAGLNAKELVDQPDAGGLFAVNMMISGPGTCYFDWPKNLLF